jgi:hypothetical protein
VSGHQVVPNAVVWDGRLSYRALGVLTVMLARQAVGATMSAAAIADGDGREGRDAVRAAMGELTAAGYLHTIRVSHGRGQIRNATRAYPQPMSPAAARMDLQGRLIRGPGNPSDESYEGLESRPTIYQAPADQAPVPTEPNNGKTQAPPPLREPGNPSDVKPGPRKTVTPKPRTPPTCPACREDHYPAAACAPSALAPPLPIPTPPAAGSPYRGRRHWAFTATGR